MASKLVIITGNIINEESVRRKAGHTAQDEVNDSLRLSLSQWNHSNIGSGFVESGTSDYVEIDSSVYRTVPAEVPNREDLIVRVKVFLTDFNAETLADAVKFVVRDPKIKYLENLTIASPIVKTEMEKLQPLQEIWPVLGSLLENKTILSFGLSDIEINPLKEIYDHAEFKPSVVQINLANCCVVPEEMQAFCKERDIQLLTHADPAELMTDSSLQQLLKERSELSSDWKPSWTARVSQSVRARGVLQSKGYVMCAKK